MVAVAAVESIEIVYFVAATAVAVAVAVVGGVAAAVAVAVAALDEDYRH